MSKLNIRRAALASSLALVASVAQAQEQAQEQRPNILWIITDDHRADALECYNKAKRGTAESELGYVSSPNLNALADEGTLFINSICNSPASAPSRGSMHTGRYPFRNGIYGFLTTHNENDCAHPVVPQVMSEAGYKTSLFGKSGYYIFKHSNPMRYTNANYYDFELNTKAISRAGLGDWSSEGIYTKDQPKGSKVYWSFPDKKVEYYSQRKDGELTAEDIATRNKIYKDQKIITARASSSLIIAGENTMPTDLTNDGALTTEFCKYLENAGKSYKNVDGKSIAGVDPSQPQFIHLGYHFPHTPVMPSKEYRDKFKSLDYNIPRLSKSEFEKMPEQIKQWVKKTSVEGLSDAEMLQAIRDYYAFCAMGDELIGKSVAKFKEYCNAQNQPYLILIACGDHGWHLGEQGVYAKFSNYIKSNETAVIVLSSDKKEFPAGKVVSDYVEFVDFAPTFFAAAGVDIKADKYDYLDGYNLVDVAAGKGSRDYVLGELNHVMGPRAYIRGKEFAFAMRSRPVNGKINAKNPPLKDIKWALECEPVKAEMTLFDLRVDPNETNNVAYDPAYVELADWFRKKLGNIVLGDGRMECNWDVLNDYKISNFAQGSDDKRLDIPAKLIPKVKK